MVKGEQKNISEKKNEFCAHYLFGDKVFLLTSVSNWTMNYYIVIIKVQVYSMENVSWKTMSESDRQSQKSEGEYLKNDAVQIEHQEQNTNKIVCI